MERPLVPGGGVQANREGWPLEQCSYWLDGAVRLAYILNGAALISKITQRLNMVVAGVLGGGDSFIYWRPKSDLDESIGSQPDDARFNNWQAPLSGSHRFHYPDSLASLGQKLR